MSNDYLSDPVKRKMAAQALANAGLYKAGDSLDYERQKEYGLLAVAAGIIGMILTLSNGQAILGMIGIAASLYVGITKHNKGKKMQAVLENNDLINKEK